MLKVAKSYEAAIKEKLFETVLDDRYRWLEIQNIVIGPNAGNSLQFVSVDSKNNVAGFFQATWKRPENFIRSLCMVNFDPEKKIGFAIDAKRFIEYLAKDLDVPKIKFSVVAGNPSEKSVNRVARNIGARLIGTSKNDVLIGNKYYDRVYYEYVNEFYECPYCGCRVNRMKNVLCEKCGMGTMYLSTPFGPRILERSVV